MSGLLVFLKLMEFQVNKSFQRCLKQLYKKIKNYFISTISLLSA